MTGVSSALQIEGGPEGIAYVPLGSDLFPNESVLISEYGAGKVAAYDTDSNGDPIPATRRDFVTGLSGAEGAFIDPVTGDFLFSTFGGGNKVVVVRGFAAPEPTPTPETGGTMLLLLVGAGICGMAINRAKAA